MNVRSLYTKFSLTTIVIMIVSSILAFMYSNFYYQQKLKPENDEKNTAIALHIADYIESHPKIAIDEYLQHISSVGYQIYLVSEEKEEFYGSPFRVKNLPKATKELVLKGEIYHGMAEFPRETFITGFFANELQNTIGVPFKHEEERYALFMRPDIKMLFNEMHFLFAWLLLLTVILSIIFVLIGARFFIHPLEELTAATKELAKGKFSIELSIDREDEIGHLANSFMNMARQLKKLDVMKNKFISNVTHDLQSPLSNIKGYVNLLEKDSLTEEERKKYASIVTKETDRLSNLTKQLLLLSSLDQEERFIHRKTFNVSEQLKDVIFNYQWLINERNLMITYSLKDMEITGDPSLLYNVWDNLLSNAIKYNKPNGEIHIFVEEDDSTISVHFKDTGIGFTKEAKDQLFDRFFREDEARTRSVEGSGLGLSIVKSIINLHEGEIQVESKKNIGSIFTITLPKG